uniref:Uncharacterized protein n=1 Tax=Anopheles albimanus TaxID=7167 RepID=A0A182FXM2_ANOAL
MLLKFNIKGLLLRWSIGLEDSRLLVVVLVVLVLVLLLQFVRQPNN